MRPGEYPLFLRDGKTWAERDADGKPLGRSGDSVCLVFSSLNEAKQFGEQKIRERPDLRCDIYDREGLRNPPLCSLGDREWNPAPRTLPWLAGAQSLSHTAAVGEGVKFGVPTRSRNQCHADRVDILRARYSVHLLCYLAVISKFFCILTEAA